MGRTACTVPRCLYKGAHYLFFLLLCNRDTLLVWEEGTETLIYYCMIVFILEEASPKTGADLFPEVHCVIMQCMRLQKSVKSVSSEVLNFGIFSVFHWMPTAGPPPSPPLHPSETKFKNHRFCRRDHNKGFRSFFLFSLNNPLKWADD